MSSNMMTIFNKDDNIKFTGLLYYYVIMIKTVGFIYVYKGNVNDTRDGYGQKKETFYN